MLTIYVRHTQLCLHGDEKKPGLIAKDLSIEELNVWKRCGCPKWYSGMLNGKRHPRASLKCNTWDDADKALDKIKEAGCPSRPDTSIAHAAKEWLAEAEIDGLASSTQRQRRSVVKVLMEFCATKKITYLRDIDPELFNAWRRLWKLTPGSAKNRTTNSKMFFRFCQRMRWLQESPIALLKTKRRKNRKTETGEWVPEEAHQTLPLDEEGDANYQRLLGAIPGFLASHPNRQGPMSDPKRLIALTELMYETGLRVCDAMMFLRDRMEVDEEGWGEYTTTQIKTGDPVTVAFPPHVVAQIRALRPLAGRYIFFDPRFKLLSFYNYHVWKQLREIGQAAGIPDMRPHRLRDSFAVNRLNEGMLMQELSKLLGHANTVITETYYAPFVRSRKKAVIANRKAMHNPQPGITPGTKVVTIRERKVG